MNNSSVQKINLVSNRGDRFCYYHCENARIGGGAMGEVFKGWRFEEPGKKVAIKKVYSRHAENPEIRRRARYEALLSIDHPNLIKMLGYCEFDRNKGPMFIVSEFVQGNTIDKFVKSIDVNNRTEIVSRMICSILDALTCLHTQEPPVWHRDIKPSNIMIENGCNVRVMDLGIATSEGISLGTVEGKGFGTYPYAPPEQIEGKRSQINGTSDIYSLGVTYYELLTGSNPFTGGSDLDIIEKQLTMSLPYNSVIPKSIFKVLLKATAKKQSNRFQSAEEFKNAIQDAFIQRPQFPGKTILIISGSILILFIIILLIAYI